jgi:Icc-related predicted phosphoesterase
MHADQGRQFIAEMDPTGVDALVLAGDISNCSTVARHLQWLSEKYSNIIYVPGNHEYYGSSFASVQKILDSLKVHLLRNEPITVMGHTFIGNTLWFPYDSQNVYYKRGMNDFSYIQDFSSWVYEENRKTIEALQHVDSSTIVVTHHAPSYRSIHPLYQGANLNRFFVTPLDSLIESRQPKLWIHGHTHTSFDYWIGATRIICNPFGYRCEDTGFVMGKVIEL